MRANKKIQKNGIRRPDVRSLKIQPRYRKNAYSETTSPEIRLAGNWLEQLGFQLGKRVVITTMKELLIIRVYSE